MLLSYEKWKLLVKWVERPQRSFTQVSCSVISESNKKEYVKRHAAAAKIHLLKLADYRWQTFLLQYVCHSISAQVLHLVSRFQHGNLEDQLSCMYNNVIHTVCLNCSNQLQCYFHRVHCTSNGSTALVAV